MVWIAWIATSAIVFAIGACLFRAGWTKVVRSYIVACIVLALASVFGIGAMFDPSLASFPKWLLLAFLPGTVILAALATKRDRDNVMGRNRDRDAVAGAAVMYGASSTHLEGSAGDAGGGSEI